MDQDKYLSKEEQKEIVSKRMLTKSDFEKVYQAHYSRILNFINSRVNRKEDAEDLTALVFERVLRKLGDFQWQDITITSWIFRIARNALIDFYRKDSDRKKDASLDKVSDFLVSNEEILENVMSDDEDELKLFDSIRELKPDDQFLIYYKFFEELSNKEIADITGLSETNVGTRLHRLRDKLKGIIVKK